MELDLEEQQPSVLEYARFHNLCRDYTLEQPCFGSVPAAPDDGLEADLEDLDVASLTDSAIELIKERLTISKEAALLLKTVFEMQQPLDEASLTTEDWRRASELRQEVPILYSDPELDLLEFGSTDVPSLKDLCLPLAAVDEEFEEGLQWPSEALAYPKMWDELAKAERLPVTKDVLLFLQDAVKDSWTPEDSEKIKEESLNHKRNPALQPLTPPLLPLSPPLTPYIPSSPGNHVELPSEASNSTAAELKALEERIMQDDALVPPLETEAIDDSMLFDIMDVETFDLLEEPPEKPTLPILKRKVDDLKIEGPLTPPMLSESSMKRVKSVTFPETMHEYIPQLPSTFGSGDDVLNSDDSFADFFRPIADEVNKKVENEKLSEADTTKRVDVPNVDFTLPLAPWLEYSRKGAKKKSVAETELEAQKNLLRQVKLNELRSWTSWHGLTKLTRGLHWEPFPAELGRITIEEKLHGEEVLSKMLAELTVGDIATSSTDIWKRDGLRILEDDEDSEEELEEAEFEESDTLDSVAKRRKLELDDESNTNAGLRLKEKRDGPVSSRPPHRPDSREATGQASRHRGKSLHDQLHVPKTADNSLMFGGMFSATAALQKFMETRGKSMGTAPMEDVESSSHFPPPTVTLPHRSTTARHESLKDASHVVTPQQALENKEPVAPSLLELPPIPSSLMPCSFIISSDLFQQRNLIREVSKIYKDADLIERDFNLTHSPAKEADILLSPSTGLIFTTLQQVKQRALPGQPDRSPIKERISRLQARYERLVVLISEGLSREAEEAGSGRPVDNRDQEALIEFEKFTSIMAAEVINKYIRGGEVSLARTIVVEMATRGLPQGSKDLGDLKPLQEETHWEVFLRRAGLNPFAAQMIVASLKVPYDLPLTSSSPAISQSSDITASIFGLPAFLLMSAEERVARFQALLGGSRILGRVSVVLDQTWPSAAHGFVM